MYTYLNFYLCVKKKDFKNYFAFIRTKIKLFFLITNFDY